MHRGLVIEYLKLRDKFERFRIGSAREKHLDLISLNLFLNNDICRGYVQQKMDEEFRLERERILQEEEEANINNPAVGTVLDEITAIVNQEEGVVIGGDDSNSDDDPNLAGFLQDLEKVENTTLGENLSDVIDREVQEEGNRRATEILHNNIVDETAERVEVEVVSAEQREEEENIKFARNVVNRYSHVTHGQYEHAPLTVEKIANLQSDINGALLAKKLEDDEIEARRRHEIKQAEEEEAREEARRKLEEEKEKENADKFESVVNAIKDATEKKKSWDTSTSNR